jgi:hypothetical protein
MAGFLTGIGDVEHHQPAMTASRLQRFCRTFNTLLGADPPSWRRQKALGPDSAFEPDSRLKGVFSLFSKAPT